MQQVLIIDTKLKKFPFLSSFLTLLKVMSYSNREVKTKIGILSLNGLVLLIENRGEKILNVIEENNKLILHLPDFLITNDVIKVFEEVLTKMVVSKKVNKVQIFKPYNVLISIKED